MTRKDPAQAPLIGAVALFTAALMFSAALVADAQQPSPAGKSATGLSSLPADAQGPVSAALGRHDADYWVRPSARGFRGENPRQAMVADFTRQGATVRSHSLRWALETRAYGYGDGPRPLRAVAPQAKANRVEYQQGDMTEWYENGPLGLEQGFTLAKPPGKANGRPLTVALAFSGDLTAALGPGGKSVELRRRDGQAALRYADLEARDAAGHELRSWLEVCGGRLLIRVEDAGARYPVVIDPWIQQAELTASDGAAGDGFGGSVAVDGSTAVVGAPYHEVSNAEPGAAYVFVQSGVTWIQQAELIASDGAGFNHFGFSVAISGSTVVVGSPGLRSNPPTYNGAAYVFVESGTTWSQQAELTASDGAAGDEFGVSVGVSGGTAIVGAPLHAVSNVKQGAAYVFAQNGTAWNQQAELTASDGALAYGFGSAVAVNGSTAVVGAPFTTVGGNTNQGAAYAFGQGGATWGQQAELTASDGAAGDNFGTSVGLSGGTAIVGATGAAYMFVQNGTTWSQQQELTVPDGGFSDFGYSVAVSGSTAAGGEYDEARAVYVFVENGGAWSQQAELTAADKFATWTGRSLATSGSTVLGGDPWHPVGLNGGQGMVYVFGLGTSAISFSPASWYFGNQVVDSTGAAKTVTVTNTGTATLDISGISASTDFAVSSTTCGATLAVGKTCSVKVKFSPAELGDLTGMLSFADDAAPSPQIVWLSGTSIEQAAVKPVDLKFPKTEVGATSAAKKVTLENNSTTALTGISYSATSPFVVSASTCGTTLGGKKTCTISVTFSPTQTGPATGTLSVSDSANNSPQTSNLTGTGK